MTISELLREDENEERREETLTDSLERREEASLLSNDPRGETLETGLRLLEMTSTTVNNEEEERDGVASLVSFTSSLYSNPAAAQHAAILLSRINNANATVEPTPMQINTENTVHERRELPPDNVLSVDEDIQMDELEEAPPIPTSLEIVTKEDTAFAEDLSNKPQPWVAMHHPQRFMQYWKDSQTHEKILTLQGVTYPDDIIQAARDIGLYADVCIIPETIVDVDKIKGMKRTAKVTVNNGERTMIVARSYNVGEILLNESNDKIRSLLQEKAAHFLKNYKSDSIDDGDFMLEPVDQGNTVNYPYAANATEDSVLMSKTMDFMQKLSRNTTELSPSYKRKKQFKNNLVDGDDDENPEMNVNNDKKMYEDDSRSSSTTTSNYDEPISFASMFGDNFKFLISCTQPICACSVPVGGMCSSPEI